MDQEGIVDDFWADREIVNENIQVSTQLHLKLVSDQAHFSRSSSRSSSHCAFLVLESWLPTEVSSATTSSVVVLLVVSLTIILLVATLFSFFSGTLVVVVLIPTFWIVVSLVLLLALVASIVVGVVVSSLHWLTEIVFSVPSSSRLLN